MKYNYPVVFMALLAVAAFASEAEPVGGPVVISAMILDDGATTEMWMGDEEGERPGVEQVRLFYLSAGRVESVIVPFANLGAYFSYSGPPAMHFYASPPPLPEEDREPPPVVATVNLPAGAREVVLMFVTDNIAAGTFRIIPIDTSGDSFPANSLRLINFSPLPIAYELGDERGMVAARGEQLVMLDPQAGYQQFQVARPTEDGQHWRSEYSRHLQVREGMRMTCLVLPRPGRMVGQPVMVRMIRENYSQRLNRLQRQSEAQPDDE